MTFPMPCVTLHGFLDWLMPLAPSHRSCQAKPQNLENTPLSLGVYPSSIWTRGSTRMALISWQRLHLRTVQ